MNQQPEGMAESLKGKDLPDKEVTPGVRGSQVGVHDAGVKGPADSATNWSRSGNPLHVNKAPSPTLEGDKTPDRSAPEDLKRVVDEGGER